MRILNLAPLAVSILFIAACGEPAEPSKELKKPIEKAEAVEQQLEEAAEATKKAVEEQSE
jgi:hypothetical protein